ncbi:MAG: TMEM175 family protein [Gemmatimonadaceae bacterium]
MHETTTGSRPRGRPSPPAVAASVEQRAEREHRRREARSETGRIEAFSDGVFSIAITLLIMAIQVPTAGTLAPGGLPAALAHLWPSYFGFALSFTIIGIMWANHHNVFKLIERSDPTFVALNTLLLMCVSFLPFPTGVLAAYVRVPAEQRAAALFYGATLTATALVFNALWLYASRGGRLLGSHADPGKVRTITARFLPGAPLYLASTLLALWSVTASLAVHALLAILYLLPERSPGRRAGSTAAALHEDRHEERTE